MEYFVKLLGRNEFFDKIRSRLDAYKEERNRFKFSSNTDETEGKYEEYFAMVGKIMRNGWLKDTIEDFLQMIDQARSHQSIDTFAKKYYLRNFLNPSLPISDKEQYNKIKTFLALYLLFEQCAKDIYPNEYPKLIPITKGSTNNQNFHSEVFLPMDSRYDQFFASLLKRGTKGGFPVLPSNLNILSWNYDIQIEMALQQFSAFEKMGDLRNHYGIYPNAEKENLNRDINNPGNIIKINGVCDLFAYDQSDKSVSQLDHLDSNLYSVEGNKVLYSFLKILKTLLPENLSHKERARGCQKNSISFAWESKSPFSPGNASMLKRAQEIVEKSDFIVIIGYSFPTFNREIDRALFSKLYHPDTELFCQDRLEKGDQISKAIIGLQPFRKAQPPIKTISDLSQFYIPSKYTPVY